MKSEGNDPVNEEFGIKLLIRGRCKSGRVIWLLTTGPSRHMSGQVQKTNVTCYLKVKSAIAGETGHITSNLNVLEVVMVFVYGV